MKLKEFKIIKEEDESVSNTNINIDISFMHDRDKEEVFKQLQELPTFKKELESRFNRLYESLLQQYIKDSSVPVGSGWTDNFECIATIKVNKPNLIIDRVEEGLNREAFENFRFDLNQNAFTSVTIQATDYYTAEKILKSSYYPDGTQINYGTWQLENDGPYWSDDWEIYNTSEDD